MSKNKEVQKVTRVGYTSTHPYYRDGVYYEPNEPFYVPETEKPGTGWRRYHGPAPATEQGAVSHDSRPSDEVI